MREIMYTFTTSGIYFTNIVYKTMVTEMLASYVNTINLILQEVKYIWNVRRDGKCSTQWVRKDGAELLSEVENGFSSIVDPP